jgi:membrane protease YdiL (CAAX protease family)
LTPLMVIGGGIVYFALYPEVLNVAALGGEGLPGMQGLAVPPQVLILVNIGGAILISPLINALPILGEEFGWRAYLQPKLLPLGERRAYLLVGVIWGVWHWPVIWMGYNYPGYPLWGSLAMVWFTLVAGTFFGWAALRAGSVWPAVIGHGALNGTANLWRLFVTTETNPLVGPYVVGVIGGIFFALAALIILWRARS